MALTDKQRKKIISDFAECGIYAEAARLNNVSATTVRETVERDTKTFEKFRQKKEENTKDILSYMATKRDLVCDFIDLYMRYLTDEEKLKKATLNQISTAFGTVIDKFTNNGMVNVGDMQKHYDLIKVIEKSIKNEN